MRTIQKASEVLVPPGPQGEFLAGNLREFNDDSLGFLARCARVYGDIVTLQFGPARPYLLNRPEYIEAVLTNNKDYGKGPALRRNRRLLGNGLLTSEGDFWRRQRHLAQPAFHRERIAAYSEVMSRFAERRLERWHDGEQLDIHEEMMALTLEIVAKTLFDTDLAYAAHDVHESLTVALEYFNNARSNALTFLFPWLPTPMNRRFAKAAERLDEIVFGMIEEHRTGGEDRGDLLSMLMAARDEEGNAMSDEQLRDEVMTLLLAGHETTANALSWTWLLLSQNPEAEAKLHAELDTILGDRLPTMADLRSLPYTDRVISESMRLYPPAWLMARETLRDTEVGGWTIPKGKVLMMSQWLMHRDPRYFDHPEAFRPERWEDDFARTLPPFAYFPFGGGARICIGQSFAKMEAILLLATIARRFRVEVLPEQQITLLPSVTLRPANGIKVALTAR